LAAILPECGIGTVHFPGKRGLALIEKRAYASGAKSFRFRLHLLVQLRPKEARIGCLILL
jgi:hypothetical protein